MNNPPCTRDLKYFEKTGCPQREYNNIDGTGCPLWLELEIPTRENPQIKKKQKKCLDLWFFTLQWSMLGMLEGNQTATESFRNAMCEPDPLNPKASGRPKSNRAILKLIEILEKEKQNRELIINHEMKKMLDYQ